ncbi:MAG: molybdenum cofactor guanylyltransferase [Phycisphaerales bacterium]|nr:molybdenum cofactor guanylyltransferase [Phycisphaerales bacterium]
MSAALRASVQPIVIVGGRSSRFGRDKLREPVPSGSGVPAAALLVDAPIAALRRVFGPRVRLVGACHADVAARGDGMIEDRYPGAGPMGGILSALESWAGPVMVLPGDLPGITARSIELLLAAANDHPDTAAVVARGERLEPCIGLYRPATRRIMARRIAERCASLHDLLPDADRVVVELPSDDLVNVNRPSDLPLR